MENRCDGLRQNADKLPIRIALRVLTERVGESL
jgi:hypothetical protein